MYEIEKGVPINGEYGAFKNTLLALEVGDSFLFPKAKKSMDLGGRMSYVKKCCPDRKFTTRAVDGGVRIWRIA